MSVPQDSYRGLGWQHGALAVQRLGAMLAPLSFVLPDGRQVSPMHVAPWADEPDAAALPGILRRLRGEWPCVPFGYGVDDPTTPAEWAAVMAPPDANEAVHGYSSNHDWRWDEATGTSLALAIDYPTGDPIRRLQRTITPDPNGPAVDIELRIEARAACAIPLGLHSTFRLPLQVGQAKVQPGRFDHGRTYPGTVEPGAALFAIDRTFSQLAAVPGRDGTSVDATTLPFASATEELLQLNGVDGTVALANHAEGYRMVLSWQAEHFPSLLLWFSNRGRQMAPWSGRHLALGMEPICSPFGLSPDTARADNPIARSGIPTARAFAAGEVFTTRYRIAVEPL
ncbi:MAG TPA: hypothetical protein VL147_18040 [Devosia sp.]|nr:hypothetical protein [Devosia sp.]